MNVRIKVKGIVETIATGLVVAQQLIFLPTAAVAKSLFLGKME
jgi:hypothetical protein